MPEAVWRGTWLLHAKYDRYWCAICPDPVRTSAFSHKACAVQHDLEENQGFP